MRIPEKYRRSMCWGHLGVVPKEKQVKMENLYQGFNLAPVQFCIIPDHILSSTKSFLSLDTFWPLMQSY